jgi:signal transduction histidine kinase
MLNRVWQGADQRVARTSRGVRAASPPGGRLSARTLPSSLGVSSFDSLIRSASDRLERFPMQLLVAVAVGAVAIGGTLSIAHLQDDRQSIDALGLALLAVGPAALYVKRRLPVVVLAITLVSTCVYLLLDYPRGPVYLAPIVAFVIAVLEGHRRAAWLALGLGYAAFFWLPPLVGDEPAPPVGKALGTAAWLLVLAAVTEIVAFRRERTLEAERARRQEALARAGQERLRIARELHDVLAHNVSLINVQAGVALHLLDEQPQRARPALEAIKQASSDTLREVRSVLGILRRPDEQAPRTPTAGVAGLEELISRTSAAGIPVRGEIRGEPRTMPASVDLAVYRIVQEALTNVARHADPAAAVVRLSYGEKVITVEVDDDGRHARANGVGGNGIAGMRERVRALGGEFSAGPRPDVGFRVTARLPLGEGQ